MKKKTPKEGELETRYEELYSFFPPLPHAWELKAGLARKITQAANFAGLLAWR
jgi:hypothetical protein